MRDGRHLIGQGVASAIYTHWRWPAKASVTIKANGTAVVEAATHELGTGTYTVMRQVAADAMGLPAEKVSVILGDTQLPESHASIGSATMANAGAAIMLAAQAARDKAIELVMKGKFSPLAGATPQEISAEGGVLKRKNGGPQVSYVDLLAKNGVPSLQASGDYNTVDEYKGPKAIFSFSSVFAEVRVDEDLGLVRLNRLVGAYDAGKIINRITARSQAIGGIIWGAGQALLEQSETDSRTGSYLHRNLSGYLVPSNADIPHLDILFCEEFDEEASPLGAKGLGELTAVSVSAAIANAVHHATGKRIRELPITIEKMMA
jgi:xanthine dehydrogenase YagR molybdenum-binding subunit